MNANELEILKPGPGFALAEITETGEAVKEIETAHAAMMATYALVLKSNNERRARQALGVSIPDCETKDWHQWQATELRRFHEIREEAAGRVLVLCDERLAADAGGIRKRESKIAQGIGQILDDAQAGADLSAMLIRLTGGLPENSELRNARNGWDRICRDSKRHLTELPKLPPAVPTASENVESLKKILTTKEG